MLIVFVNKFEENFENWLSFALHDT